MAEATCRTISLYESGMGRTVVAVSGSVVASVLSKSLVEVKVLWNGTEALGEKAETLATANAKRTAAVLESFMVPEVILK